MKFVFSALFTLFLFVDSNAQTCEVTGSPDPAFFDTSLGNESNNYKIKVYFNLVYNDQGTNGYPKERLSILINNIRQEFDPLGIFFRV